MVLITEVVEDTRIIPSCNSNKAVDMPAGVESHAEEAKKDTGIIDATPIVAHDETAHMQ